MRRKRRRDLEKYLRLHGAVHRRRLRGGTVGEGFRRTRRQRGLLGGGGGLRGALQVFAVALIHLDGLRQRQG